MGLEIHFLCYFVTDIVNASFFNVRDAKQCEDKVRCFTSETKVKVKTSPKIYHYVKINHGMLWGSRKKI